LASASFAGVRGDARRVVLHDLAVDLGRGVELAGVDRGLGVLQRLLDRRLAASAALGREIVDELLELALGLAADEAVDRLAVREAVDGGDRLDAELGGELLVLVDVDLDQLDLAAGLLDRLLQRRGELLARPAPRRPEVDDHGRLARGGDDVLLEAGGVAVLDEVGPAFGPLLRGADNRFHGHPSSAGMGIAHCG